MYGWTPVSNANMSTTSTSLAASRVWVVVARSFGATIAMSTVTPGWFASNWALNASMNVGERRVLVDQHAERAVGGSAAAPVGGWALAPPALAVRRTGESRSRWARGARAAGRDHDGRDRRGCARIFRTAVSSSVSDRCWVAADPGRRARGPMLIDDSRVSSRRGLPSTRLADDELRGQDDLAGDLVAAPRWRRAAGSRARGPSTSSDCRTLDSVGRVVRAIGASSKPITATSSGHAPTGLLRGPAGRPRP